MEYSLERIHEMFLGDLKDKEYSVWVFAFFHPTPLLDIADRNEVFRAFLGGLPSAVDQLKIRDRFQAIAKQRGLRATNFRWWDIVNPPEFYLLADLVHGGLTIQLGLNWRTYQPGTKPLGSMTNVSFRPDLKNPDSAHLVIESHTYQEVKAAFRTWLDSQAPPLESVLPPSLALPPSA